MHNWIFVNSWRNAHQETWGKWVCKNCDSIHESRMEKPPDPNRLMHQKHPDGRQMTCGDYVASGVMGS